MAPIRIPPTYNFQQASGPVTFTVPFFFGSGYPLVLGSRFDDTFYGSSGTDQIFGWYGNDVIYGNGGNDILSGEEGYDRVYGGDGTDLIFGGNGYDTLYGDAGDDAIYGDAGWDTLYGGSGADFMFGGADGDVLSGETGNDYLDGGADDDQLSGGDGDDVLLGGEGWDVLEGGHGADYLDGGAGYNTLSGGSGADVFNGGAGGDDIRGDDAYPAANFSDTVRYLDSASGVAATLTETSFTTWVYDPVAGRFYRTIVTEGHGSGTAGDAAGDSYFSIENIEGSRYDDTLVGNSFANSFLGFEGNDMLSGGAGHDYLSGGYGDDTLTGGDGDDTLYGGGVLSRTAAMPALPGWPSGSVGSMMPVLTDVSDVDLAEWWHENGNDVLNGGAGDDRMLGGSGNDTLTGGSGHNAMYGGDGDDMLVAGKDAEIIDGDTRYEDLPSGSIKGTGRNAMFEIQQDAFGSDTVNYSGSEAGIRLIFSEYFTDFNMAIDLGGGFTLSPWIGTLRTTATGVGGSADGDELFSIENVIGGGGDDHVVATANISNRLQGNGGDDYLDGGNGGTDVFLGNNGFDTLVGGRGGDTFIYNGASDAQDTLGYTGGAIQQRNVETIQRFTSGQDVVDLLGVDAIEASWRQDDAFTIVNYFSGQAGELMVDAFATTAAGDYIFAVAGDTTGDGVGDFLIQVEMAGGTKLQRSDFLL